MNRKSQDKDDLLNFNKSGGFVHDTSIIMPPAYSWGSSAYSKKKVEKLQSEGMSQLQKELEELKGKDDYEPHDDPSNRWNNGFKCTG